MDTWITRDLPVLRALVKLDTAQGPTTAADIRAHTGIDDATIQEALHALAHATTPLLGKVDKDSDKYDSPYGAVWGVTDEARRIVGTWPTPATAVDRLIAALLEQAESAEDGQTRVRLRSIANWLGTSGRDFTVTALSSIVGPATTPDT